MDQAAGRGPLRERAAGAELHIVRMGADRECHRRHGQVGPRPRPGWRGGCPGSSLIASRSSHPAHRATARRHGRANVAARPGWSRSAGRSTSHPRLGSRTTRSARPRRRASAPWRRNDPGPYGEPEPALRRDAGDVGAIVVTVGHEGDAVVRAPATRRRVRAADRHGRRRRDRCRRRRARSLHRRPRRSTRAPGSRAPQLPRPTPTARPPRRRTRRRPGGGRDAASTPLAISRASAARHAGSSAEAKRTFRVAEALDGHQHGGAHRGESMVRAMPIRGAVGVLGRPGWAEVNERGAVRAADGSWRLDWWVGADRWRDPRNEVSVRHGPRDGAPVFETALRVDGGDVRQHVYTVAERDGLVMVEVENDSPAPVAIAFLLPRSACAHADLSSSTHRWSRDRRVPVRHRRRRHGSRCRTAGCCG